MVQYLDSAAEEIEHSGRNVAGANLKHQNLFAIFLGREAMLDPPSEGHVEAKLDLSWRKHVRCDLSGSGNTDQVVGYVIVLNVEDVEEFRPE